MKPVFDSDAMQFSTWVQGVFSSVNARFAPPKISILWNPKSPTIILHRLTDFLLKGRENALTARKLSQVVHLPRRTVTRAIERARRRGAPILAVTDSPKPGYYLASDAGETRRYIADLRRRAADSMEAAL